MQNEELQCENANSAKEEYEKETGLKVVSELNAKDKLALEINNKSIEDK